MLRVLLWFCTQQQLQRHATLVLLAVVQCTSHQVHLCSRSALALIGGTAPEQRKAFVRGLVGAAHTFRQSSYFFRVYVGLAKAADAVQFASSGGAPGSGLTEALTEARGLKAASCDVWFVG